MTDLIDRQKAIDEMKARRDAAKKWYDEADEDSIRTRADSAVMSFMECIMTLQKLPPAEQKTGKYIETRHYGDNDDFVYTEYVCSECGDSYEYYKPSFKYCPNCGAKMEAEDE